MPLIDGGTQRLPRIVGLGPGARHDPHRAHRGRRRGRAIGLVTEIVPPGRHLERALELAEKLAAFPAGDDARRPSAAIEGLGMPLAEALALESRAGPDVFEDAIRGAARFASGEGRGGAGAGA